MMSLLYTRDQRPEVLWSSSYTKVRTRSSLIFLNRDPKFFDSSEILKFSNLLYEGPKILIMEANLKFHQYYAIYKLFFLWAIIYSYFSHFQYFIYSFYYGMISFTYVMMNLNYTRDQDLKFFDPHHIIRT